MSTAETTERKSHIRSPYSLYLVCEAIDEYGPMSVAEIGPLIDYPYEWVRKQAKAGVEQGYLIETERPRPAGGHGRPLKIFSRTSVEISEAMFSRSDPRGCRTRREQRAIEERYEATVVLVRRDPFTEAFFGEYRAQS